MALRVPPPQIASIRAFLELSDRQMDAFIGALAQAGPQFNVNDLSAEISSPLGLPQDLTFGIIRVLASLYLTRDRRQPIEKFVDDDVHAALMAARAFSPEQSEVQWQKLRKFLLGALTLERSLGTAAKAGPVLTEHERIFTGAKIMTDFRPIFHLNVSDKPDAAVVIHMLKISTRDHHQNHSDQYFALDSNDLVVMKHIIERAIEKEKTLRRIVKDSGVTVLDPRLLY
jgi:hypothetical protein